METLVYIVDPSNPDAEVIAKAAALLRSGGLVAFPTETVYGLGANALDSTAVERIFKAKGRPATNPIIVHVGDLSAARRLTNNWPEMATLLSERFWPGPLTLVLPKAAHVPDVVTAGGATVAVRMPAHPAALALLRSCSFPLAAPSANRSSRLSPTRGEHVLSSLNGRIDMLLDAGPTVGGLESTVLDLSCTSPRILRPGLVSAKEIEAIIGPLASFQPENMQEPLKSPGLLVRHYSPRTPLECVAEDGGAHVRRLLATGLRLGWLTCRPSAIVEVGLKTIVMANNPQEYAAKLYAALHELDEAQLDRIVVALPPDTEEWIVVLDRLKRASVP
jgi:L-threonylcarbamoyladenylate synthase